MLNRRTLSAVAAAAMAFVLGASRASADTVINLTTFQPNGNDTVTQTYSATASQGTLGPITSSVALPINANSTVASTTYGFSLTGLTIGSVPGYALTWDIVMSAADAGTSGTDTVGLLANGGAIHTWVVDGKLTDSTVIASGGTTEITRINAIESITSVLQNVVLTGPGRTVSSAVFTASGDEILNLTGSIVTQTGSGTNTYTVTAGSGTAFRLSNLDVSFTVIPNPAALPAGLGLLAMMGVRRRRRSA